MTIKECFESAILRGVYNAEEMVHKVNTLWIDGKLTEEERNELVSMAYDHANDEAQIDIVTKLADLEERIFALEHPAQEEPVYPVWTAGYVTKKGEVVLFDYNGDGVMDMLRYDGGRASTSLKPGKIDGWHVVDAQGNILGTWYNNEFTPVVVTE